MFLDCNESLTLDLDTGQSAGVRHTYYTTSTISTYEFAAGKRVEILQTAIKLAFLPKLTSARFTCRSTSIALHGKSAPKQSQDTPAVQQEVTLNCLSPLWDPLDASAAACSSIVIPYVLFERALQFAKRDHQKERGSAVFEG